MNGNDQILILTEDNPPGPYRVRVPKGKIGEFTRMSKSGGGHDGTHKFTGDWQRKICQLYRKPAEEVRGAMQDTLQAVMHGVPVPVDAREDSFYMLKGNLIRAAVGKSQMLPVPRVTWVKQLLNLTSPKMDRLEEYKGIEMYDIMDAATTNPKGETVVKLAWEKWVADGAELSKEIFVILFENWSELTPERSKIIWKDAGAWVSTEASDGTTVLAIAAKNAAQIHGVPLRLLGLGEDEEEDYDESAKTDIISFLMQLIDLKTEESGESIWKGRDLSTELRFICLNDALKAVMEKLLGVWLEDSDPEEVVQKVRALIQTIKPIEDDLDNSGIMDELWSEISRRINGRAAQNFI